MTLAAASGVGGSSGMTCAEVRALAHAYVDRELTGADREAVEQHADGCAPCAAALRFQGRFRAAVRVHLPRPPVPRALEAQLRAALAAEGAPRARWGWPASWSWARLRDYPRLVPALAAAVALVVVMGSLRQRRSFLMEQARRTYQAEMPMDVLGDCRSVASWFRGRLDFPVSAPVLSGQATCQGGRLVNVRDRPAAYVVYLVPGGHRIGLLVFEPTDDEDLVPHAVDRRVVRGHEIYYGHGPGVSTAVYQDRGLGYVLTSDLDEDALTRLVVP